MERVLRIKYEGALFSKNEIEIGELIKSLQGLSSFLKIMQSRNGKGSRCGDIKVKGTFLKGSFEIFVVINDVVTFVGSICGIISLGLEVCKKGNGSAELKYSYDHIEKIQEKDKNCVFKIKKSLVEFFSILQRQGADKISITEYIDGVAPAKPDTPRFAMNG